MVVALARLGGGSAGESQSGMQSPQQQALADFTFARRFAKPQAKSTRRPKSDTGVRHKNMMLCRWRQVMIRVAWPPNLNVHADSFDITNIKDEYHAMKHPWCSSQRGGTPDFVV